MAWISAKLHMETNKRRDHYSHVCLLRIILGAVGEVKIQTLMVTLQLGP